jgi:chaperone required for assembly of F1-ATPase
MKLRCYFLIFTSIVLSLTSCGQPKSFQKIDRTFKKSNAIEKRSFNLQTDDRTTKSPEESAIVLGIFGFQLLCYLLVWKFRGREEANKMARAARKRIRK